MDNGRWLVICGTDPKVGAIRIKEGVNVIGRGSNCDIHLPHSMVSRPHAILVNDNGKLLIRDLGSQNGVFVDGKPVRSATIKVGSSLRLGQVVFNVVDHPCDRSASEMDDDETDSAPVAEPGDAALRAARFSPVRKQVQQMLLHGYSEKQIAYQLDLSDHRVHRHTKNIYKALGVHTRAKLSACFHANAGTPVEITACG